MFCLICDNLYTIPKTFALKKLVLVYKKLYLSSYKKNENSNNKIFIKVAKKIES